MRYAVHRTDDLGTAVAEFRARRGLSQAELARRVGLNRTYLSNLEQGEVPAYVERLLTLLGALGATITIADS